MRALFVTVNRMLAPPEMRDAFEAYIARSLKEEIARIPDYYREHDGAFWVACREADLVGTFGLERVDRHSFELRRMYVSPNARRQGIGSKMPRHAEDECRRLGVSRLELSTSELQPAAVALYRAAGYRSVREMTADESSHKTVGGGIRRFYFDKAL